MPRAVKCAPGYYRRLGLRSLAFIGAALTMTSQPIFTKLSQVNGRFEYAIITCTLFSEIFKLSFSIVALLALAVEERHRHGGSVLRALDELCPRSFLPFVKYGVPSLVYMLNNNLIFIVLKFISATTFQIFACMKTIMTGATMHLTGMKKLTSVQMAAVALLACSIFIVTSPSDKSKDGEESARDANKNVVAGLLLSLCTCALSTAGGVYNEKLMKDQKSVTIHWQNIQMYTWGVALNAIALSYQDSVRILEGGFTQGYNGWTWTTIANNTLTGLCISAVLKFLDNIARVYAHGFAMLATFVVEIVLFGHPIEAKLVAAIWVISGSSYVYNLPLVRRPTEDKAVQEDEAWADAHADAGAVELAARGEGDADAADGAGAERSRGDAHRNGGAGSNAQYARLL
mmetsp:Transcript_8966/g.26065  ORF Transcript_8966/g.26065 Transcript_8966/m.26065 type:complete len:401 (+) Transcript_8966:38-1240(+)